MHVQETTRRKVDLSSSYLEGTSKPGLNRSLRPLSCQRQHVCTCIYLAGIFTSGAIMPSLFVVILNFTKPAVLAL